MDSWTGSMDSWTGPMDSTLKWTQTWKSMDPVHECMELVYGLVHGSTPRVQSSFSIILTDKWFKINYIWASWKKGKR